MRVDSSQLQLSAQSRLARRELELRTNADAPARNFQSGDQVSIRASALEAARRQLVAETRTSGTQAANGSDLGAQTDDPRLELMLKIAEALLGYKIKLYRGARSGGSAPVSLPSRQAGAQAAPAAQVRVTRVQTESESR